AQRRDIGPTSGAAHEHRRNPARNGSPRVHIEIDRLDVERVPPYQARAQEFVDNVFGADGVERLAGACQTLVRIDPDEAAVDAAQPRATDLTNLQLWGTRSALRSRSGEQRPIRQHAPNQSPARHFELKTRI